MNALYICYQSIKEPLTSNQVVTYLEGLTRAGHIVRLLTYEPSRLVRSEARLLRRQLFSRGIVWTSLRYHKRPSLLATLWDVIVGAGYSWYLVRRHRIDLLHARSHVAGLMALIVSRLTGARFLFDVRGLLAEEYVDAGLWRKRGLMFRLTKWVEGRLVASADGLVVLTQCAADLLSRWYPQSIANKPMEVIPCCIRTSADSLPDSRDVAEESLRLVYVGKLRGRYFTEAMLSFLIAVLSFRNAVLEVWTQDDPAQFLQQAQQAGVEDRVRIGFAPPEKLRDAIAGAHGGLAFYRDGVSRVATSPTKVADYLAAGVPPVASRGVGDVDALLRGNPSGPVGITVDDAHPASYRVATHQLLELLTDVTLRARCRSVAAAELDIEEVGWVRYERIYQALDGRDAA